MTTVTMSGVRLAHDDRGEVAQLHGLGIQRFGDLYYAYGENKVKGNLFQGVVCYTSPDLQDWTNRGIVLPVRDEGLLAADTIAERPKVLRCPSTGEYVMYVHAERHDYSYAHVAVAVADDPLGPFRFLFSMQPFGNISRDIGVFQDEGGEGYLLSEDREHGTHIYRLSADYHSVVEDVVCLKGTDYAFGYESPTMIRHEGLYYWFGSQLTGWDCNDNMFATAPAIEGPWSDWRPFTPEGSRTFDSQCDLVLPLPDGQFLYIGDRWNPDDLGNSPTLWLPIRIGGGNASLEWHDEWHYEA
ncbi:family 43 glycosylhydrolase [Bifidobacterium eulemuris]|uniref:Family 43 glycoside hydrolase n=2 Tax=Bifidobacterium eulemuris TaxID=1765219 RepID=A0A261GBI0_9BIFI|nr:family 43 glycosylhydrolase [Bifidobacterium eulemuris]OZG68336.1 family 43 glycoside hydrolase [Bifidobacterium eulemuris]